MFVLLEAFLFTCLCGFLMCLLVLLLFMLSMFCYFSLKVVRNFRLTKQKHLVQCECVFCSGQDHVIKLYLCLNQSVLQCWLSRVFCSFFRWETHGDWTIHQPLPVIRLRLMAEDSSLFALDPHKELARVCFCYSY